VAKRKTRGLALGNGNIHMALDSLNVVLPPSGVSCGLLNSLSQRTPSGAELTICSYGTDSTFLESYVGKTALTTDHLELTAFRSYYRTP
jgi:hypothetical protein